MGILSALGSLHAAAIDEERSVPPEAIEEIQAATSTVPVRVLRGDGGQVRFHLHGKSMEEVRLACSIEGGKAIVGLEARHVYALWGLLNLDIYIPAEYGKSLSIQTTTGPVKLEPIHLASLAVRTTSGAITFDECSAEDAKVETTSGHIALKNVKGNLEMMAKSGSVFAGCAVLDHQSIRAETSTGSITVALPVSAEFLLDAKSSSGSIDTDFPLPGAETPSRKTLQGRIGKKDNDVSLRTSAGSIRIQKQ